MLLRADAVPRSASRCFLGLLLLVAVTRAPFVLFHGRFWAEEGSTYFEEMAQVDSLVGLLFVYRQAGYYHLFANVGTWAASQVSLIHSPLVTAWLSFGVVAAMAWVASSWPSELLPTAGARIAAAALLVLGTLADPEVWLNTLHAQTYLAIVALLLLFVDVGSLRRGRYAAGIGMLIAAGLSGLYSAVLAPLYVAQALYHRTLRRSLYAIVITAAALVQLVVLLSSRFSGHLAETKLAIPGPKELVTRIARRHVGAFVLGRGNAAELLDAANSAFVLGALALAVAVFLFLLLRRVPSARLPLLLIGAMVLTEILVQLGSLRAGGGRYTVIPISILTLMLVHGAATARHRWLPHAGTALCAVVLIVGISEFWTQQPKSLRCIDCPRWDHEVRRWRAGIADRLDIWPYPGWRIVLPRPRHASAPAAAASCERRHDGGHQCESPQPPVTP